MHPIERLLGLAQLYRQRGDPIPLDLLAQADQHLYHAKHLGRNRIETRSRTA